MRPGTRSTLLAAALISCLFTCHNVVAIHFCIFPPYKYLYYLFEQVMYKVVLVSRLQEGWALKDWLWRLFGHILQCLKLNVPGISMATWDFRFNICVVRLLSFGGTQDARFLKKVHRKFMCNNYIFSLYHNKKQQ